MSDAQNIENALRLIEGYVGEGEPLPSHITTWSDLFFDIRNFSESYDEVVPGLLECGDWAIEVALKRYHEANNAQ